MASTASDDGSASSRTDAAADDQGGNGPVGGDIEGGDDGHNDDGHDDDDDDNDESGDKDLGFCTFAVTGPAPSFQAIFVCHECFREGAAVAASPLSGPPSEAAAPPQSGPTAARTPLVMAPLCICQACADACHGDDVHDVEYVGMGPAYCDCDHMGGCKILHRSVLEAARIGIARTLFEEEQLENGSINPSKQPPPAPPPPSRDERGNEGGPPLSLPPDAPPGRPTFVQEVFDIPFLQEAASADMFVRQAHELVRHTKDSHWVDETTMNAPRTGTVSGLESLAWSIYQAHRVRHEGLWSNLGNKAAGGGAEWWVQVKDITRANGRGEKGPDGSELTSSTIGLHYDKDEALAESFGIGSFPTLSTVTYLSSAAPYAAPTIVFDHTYSQGEDEVMHTILASRPRLGKHLVFDGRLLHGAPSHLYLQPLETIEEATGGRDGGESKEEGAAGPQGGGEDTDPPSRRFRVTFLVNIWKDRRPANVRSLDDQVRQQLVRLAQSDARRSGSATENPLMMTQLTIPTEVVGNEKDLPEVLRRRIELPFVADDSDALAGDDAGGGTVVVTFPPPPNVDTVSVSFGPGMQAYIDYSSANEGEDGHDSNPTSFPSTAQQSYYI